MACCAMVAAPPSSDRHSRLLRILVWVFLGLNVAYVPGFMLADKVGHPLVWLQLLAVAGWVIVDVLNRRAHVTAARLMSIGLPAVQLGIIALCVGREALVHMYVIMGLSYPFIIFPPHQLRLLYGSCAVILLDVIGVEVWLLFHAPLLVLSVGYVNFLRLAMILGLVPFVFLMAYYNYVVMRRAEDELKREHAKSESLLLNILPTSIAERLKADPTRIADGFENATVLFADIVHFTELSAKRTPAQLVEMLDDIFSGFDAAADKHGLEKIKTIGDAYMAAAGIPVPCAAHAERVADMALEMQELMRTTYAARYPALQLRIGIHCGPAVAGVIGKRKFTYDLWGDSVNTASRMESHGLPGRVHVSAAVKQSLAGQFSFESRGRIEVKGKGEMETYFLVGRLDVHAAQTG